MLVQDLGFMALAVSTIVGGATGLPNMMDERDAASNSSITVSWDLAHVSFMLGTNTTVLYNVSLPTSQSESQMYFFLCKTSSPEGVSSANTAEVLRLPGKATSPP